MRSNFLSAIMLSLLTVSFSANAENLTFSSHVPELWKKYLSLSPYERLYGDHLFNRNPRKFRTICRSASNTIRFENARLFYNEQLYNGKSDEQKAEILELRREHEKAFSKGEFPEEDFLENIEQYRDDCDKLIKLISDYDSKWYFQLERLAN